MSVMSGLSHGVRWLIAGVALVAMPVAAEAATLTVVPPVDGTITATGVNCGPSVSDCSQDYSPGTVVTLTATSANGYQLDAWGDGCSQAEGVATCVLTMDADRLASAAFALVWTNRVGVTGEKGALIKDGEFEALTNPHGPHWDAGAASQWAILSGDGYAEFTLGANTVPGTYWMAGLSHDDSDTTWEDVDYALYVHGNGYAYASEPGMNQVRYLGPWAQGDVFRVEIAAGEVVYRRNGEVLYHHPIPSCLTPRS
jgi:hypothetical protein